MLIATLSKQANMSTQGLPIYEENVMCTQNGVLLAIKKKFRDLQHMDGNGRHSIR